MGAEPEEADKEEADAAEHPDPGDELSKAAIDKIIALLAAASDIEDWIDLQPWITSHRSIHDWTRPWGPIIETFIDEEFDCLHRICGIPLEYTNCLLYTSPSPRDRSVSRMPSSA